MHCTPSMQSRQRGLSMIGFLFVAVVLVMIAMLAMKLVPAYIEYFSVKKILATMGQESDLKSKSNADIRNDFAKRAEMRLCHCGQARRHRRRPARRCPGRFHRLHIPHQARRQCQPGGRFQCQFRPQRRSGRG